jgi:hypothetical protein
MIDHPDPIGLNPLGDESVSYPNLGSRGTYA